MFPSFKGIKQFRRRRSNFQFNFSFVHEQSFQWTKATVNFNIGYFWACHHEHTPPCGCYFFRWQISKSTQNDKWMFWCKHLCALCCVWSITLLWNSKIHANDQRFVDWVLEFLSVCVNVFVAFFCILLSHSGIAIINRIEWLARTQCDDKLTFIIKQTNMHSIMLI